MVKEGEAWAPLRGAENGLRGVAGGGGGCPGFSADLFGVGVFLLEGKEPEGFFGPILWRGGASTDKYPRTDEPGIVG